MNWLGAVESKTCENVSPAAAVWSENSTDCARTVPAAASIVAAEATGLRLTAEAEDAEKLAVVEDVVARHLVRFGEKDELVVDWS